MGERYAPIGVFDSGIGGLSVLRPLCQLLPTEDVIYVADAAWCPYGPKSADVVRWRVAEITQALIAQGAKLVVIACNSATTAALTSVRLRYWQTPFVGMEPAVKPAAAQTRSGSIGVLATAVTAGGEALARLVDRFGRGVAVHVAVPEGLVELVEAGLGNSSEAETLLRPIVSRWSDLGVDLIVLGCTHYPFARRAIERLAGPAVRVIDPAPAVAKQAVRVLAASRPPASRPPAERPAGGHVGRLSFLTSGDPATLRQAVERVVPPVWAARWMAGARFAALEQAITPSANGAL